MVPVYDHFSSSVYLRSMVQAMILPLDRHSHHVLRLGVAQRGYEPLGPVLMLSSVLKIVEKSLNNKFPLPLSVRTLPLRILDYPL